MGFPDPIREVSDPQHLARVQAEGGRVPPSPRYKQRFRPYFHQLSISDLSLHLERATRTMRCLTHSLAIEVGFLHEVDGFAA